MAARKSKNEKSDEKAVAATEETESAVATAADYAEFEGAGFDNQDNADIAVPFLLILQSGSPQVKKDGIEGAEEGMLYNSVTEQLWSGEDGLLFVPSTTEHVYNEWVPRTKGGGFVATYGVNDKVVVDAKKRARDENAEFGKLKTEAGNDLVETFNVYGVLCPEDGESQPVIISFTSTKIKVYKKWNSKLRMFVIPTQKGKIKPPIFAHLTRIQTVEQKNTKGTFYNFVMEPAEGDVKSSLLKPSDERFIAASEMRQMVDSGVAKADMSSAANASGGNGDYAEGGTDSEEAPF